jgi:hypothetical protein
MQYKYKVCKGQKVLALSTTLREAEQEAQRVGGVVLAIGSKRRNPLDPTSTDTYVPQGAMVGTEFFYTFIKEAGIPSEQQMVAKMIRLYHRLVSKDYLYPGAKGFWEVAKDIPVKAFFDAAGEVGLLAHTGIEPPWREMDKYVSSYSVMDLFNPTFSKNYLPLYQDYYKKSAGKIGDTMQVARMIMSALEQAGYLVGRAGDFYTTQALPYSVVEKTIKKVLEDKLTEIGPKRIKKERVRVATEKAKAEQATADKQAHEGASKFPLRPVGEDTAYGGVPQPADAAAVRPGEKYLVTMLAPKCFAPVAYYLIQKDINGYSPDLTLYYTRAYFDGSETTDDGIHRIHMSGLQNYNDDKGKGIGPLAYISTPFAAADKYQQAAVFSPREDPNDKYTYRTKDAHRAWENLNNAGLVTEEYESGTEDVSERVDLYDYFEAGSGNLDEWDSLDDIDPRYATLYGTKGEGGEVVLDVLQLRTVLLERMTLHVDKDLYEEIARRRLLLPGDNGLISPPAETWADIDLLHCTPDEVERMVEFCSRHSGDDQAAYLREVAGVIGTNPTYRKGTLDNLLGKFGLEVKTQNPRRRKNPEAQNWVNKHKQAFWDAPDANKQAGQESEVKKNPKASKKLSANQQKKYLGTLKGAAREARASEILHRREHRSNAPFKTDKGQQTKKSSHAVKFAQKYGRAPHDVADAARLAKVSERVLNEVYARGMAAWQTGHRPGASQHAWAMARVESFLTGGPTSKTADADLARKLR